MSLRISEMQDAGTPNGSERVEVSQLSATVRRTSTGLSFSAIDNSINDAAFGFVSAGFTVGDTVQVSGSASNDRASATVTALTSGKMVLGATLTTEAAGAAVTVAQWVTRSTPLPVGEASSEYTNTPETTAARTLALDDHKKCIVCSNAAGCAITVPPQASVAWPDEVSIIGVGTLGNVTFVEGASVEILIPDGRLFECYKGAPWALRRLASNQWVLAGYLAEV